MNSIFEESSYLIFIFFKYSLTYKGNFDLVSMALLWAKVFWKKLILAYVTSCLEVLHKVSKFDTLKINLNNNVMTVYTCNNAVINVNLCLS